MPFSKHSLSVCFVFFAYFWATSSYACSCTSFEWAPSDYVEQADVVFFGIPVSAKLDAEEWDADAIANGSAEFKSIRSVKGIKDGEIVKARFTANGSSCDHAVAVGLDTFYFLHELDGTLYFTLCGQPVVFGDQLTEYLDIFENGYGVAFDEMRRITGQRGSQ